MAKISGWISAGMSRASWYRHGKPSRSPRGGVTIFGTLIPKQTMAEQARQIGMSERTLYREKCLFEVSFSQARSRERCGAAGRNYGAVSTNETH